MECKLCVWCSMCYRCVGYKGGELLECGHRYSEDYPMALCVTINGLDIAILVFTQDDVYAPEELFTVVWGG